MRVLFLVNQLDELDPQQTTSALMHRAREMGLEVYAAGVEQLELSAIDRVQVRARPVGPGGIDEMLLTLPDRPQAYIGLKSDDLVWIRTNPARDAGRAWAHASALDLLELALEQGTTVLNDPRGLRRASSKLYMARVPANLRPETLTSASASALRAFVEERGHCVVKPLAGTWGQDVYRVHPQAENLTQILDQLTRRGMALAQEYVKEAGDGDVRLVVVDGRPLEVDGAVLAVRRRPGQGDFRSNIHAGGTAEPVVVDQQLRAVSDAVGPLLRSDGIFLAGLDVIGGKLIEINAFSTGGLYDAERFYGVDFGSVLVRAACARAGFSLVR